VLFFFSKAPCLKDGSLSQSTSALGGLKAAVLSDFKSETTLTQLPMLALIGELITSPWMKKFYTASEKEVNHIEGIAIVKGVHDSLKKMDPAEYLKSTDDLFGNKLTSDGKKLQIIARNNLMFKKMMQALCEAISECITNSTRHIMD
jgi:hypothetical protein